MRILHCSDLHIGVENYGRTDPSTGRSTRLGDFLAALDELVEFARSNSVDLVLLAGDAYKGRDPSQTHQREFAIRLRQLSEAGIPTFLLAGNHDLPQDGGRAHAVEIFSTLPVANVHVSAQLRNHTVPTPAGPLQILTVPWPRRGDMIARAETSGLNIEQIRQEMERRMTLAIATRAEELDPDIPAILTGHVTVNGATAGSERSMMLGHDHVLNISAVQRPQLEYVALGHIHKHQVLRPPAAAGSGDGNGPAVVYSGSMQRVDFSEEADEKGFCVIDIDPSAPQGRRLTNFRFHTLAARPFVTVDASIPATETDPTGFVVRAIGRKAVAGAIVRVRLDLSGEHSALLRDADILDALSSAHYVAGIARTVADQTRSRLPEGSQDLQPLSALRHYLEQQNDMTSERQRILLERAEELLTEINSANEPA